MILDIDYGNYYTKLRLHGKTEVSHIKTKDMHQSRWWLPWRDISIQRIRIASVNTAMMNQKLHTDCRQKLAVTPEFATVPPQDTTISHCYANPENLGIDRWLTMRIVHKTLQQSSNQSALIVHSGSAVVLDVIQQNGTHQGGFITPGLGLMAASLATLQALPLVQYEHTPALVLGNNTQNAICAGCLQMLVKLIEHSYQQCPKPTSLVLCGGDSQLLAHYLPNLQPSVKPHLVLDGLAHALP